MYSRINNDESSVGGLILAAGLSTRMGQSKPLTKFLDKKLIDQTIKTMQEAGIDNIQIVTGFEHERVEAYLQDNYSSDHIHTIWNPNYGNGSILTSIKTGLAELTDYELVFIQLVDLPCIMSETYQKLLEAMLVNGKKAVIPTVDGHRGHPALIRMDLLADILTYEGSAGGHRRHLLFLIREFPLRSVLYLLTVFLFPACFCSQYTCYYSPLIEVRVSTQTEINISCSFLLPVIVLLYPYP